MGRNNQAKANDTKKTKAEKLPEVIKLRSAGYNYLEISRVVGVAPNTVKAWLLELEAIEDPEEIIRDRRAVISLAIKKAAIAFNPQPGEITANQFVSLLNYADKIEGVDRHLASQQPEIEALPLLRVELTGMENITLDEPPKDLDDDDEHPIEP